MNLVRGVTQQTLLVGVADPAFIDRVVFQKNPVLADPCLFVVRHFNAPVTRIAKVLPNVTRFADLQALALGSLAM